MQELRTRQGVSIMPALIKTRRRQLGGVGVVITIIAIYRDPICWDRGLKNLEQTLVVQYGFSAVIEQSIAHLI